MAKKNNNTGEGLEPRMAGRSFKPDASKFETIDEGKEFTGTFIGYSEAEITDKTTREKKLLKILRLRGADDQVHKFPMAAMMLRAWEDICDEYGNGDLDTTVNTIRNWEMTIIRGSSVKRSQGAGSMGTYEIVLYDPTERQA